MKLQQNQVWRQGDHYLRIVQLQRLTVDYKLMQDPAKKEGSHHHATKKEFCRLLKGAVLVLPGEKPSPAAEKPPANQEPAAPPDASPL